MKNTVLILLVFLSLFNCKNDKNAKYISVEKEYELQNESVSNLNDTVLYAEQGLKYAL